MFVLLQILVAHLFQQWCKILLKSENNLLFLSEFRVLNPYQKFVFSLYFFTIEYFAESISDYRSQQVLFLS